MDCFSSVSNGRDNMKVRPRFDGNFTARSRIYLKARHLAMNIRDKKYLCQKIVAVWRAHAKRMFNKNRCRMRS